MAYQTVFKRYEIKYMITQEQKDRILKAVNEHMTMDKWGRSTIRNIYYDTPDFILARHSIAKPDFKEKLRIRSYGQVSEDDTVFVELKRKYDHVVYKRRVALPEANATAWADGVRSPENVPGPDGRKISAQMTEEINYFLDYYGSLRPAAFISYDREAYRMKDDAADTDPFAKDLRITFDENILARDFDISLQSAIYGVPVLEPGKILMEIKCSGGIPLWLVSILSAERVYKTSFSKYGRAYSDLIYPTLERPAAEQAGRAAALENEQGKEYRQQNRRGLMPQWGRLYINVGRTA